MSVRPLSDKALLIQAVPMKPVIKEYGGHSVPLSAMLGRAIAATRLSVTFGRMDGGMMPKASGSA